jgi:hypothetical protein
LSGKAGNILDQIYLSGKKSIPHSLPHITLPLPFWETPGHEPDDLGEVAVVW